MNNSGYKRILRVLALELTGFLIAGILTSCVLFSVKPWERKKLHAYYSDESNDIRVLAKIDKVYHNSKGGNIVVSLAIDEAWYYSEYGTEIPKNMTASLFSVQEANVSVLLEHEIDLDDCIGQEFLFLTSSKIWWDGWDLPIIEVTSADGTKEYLASETGRKNLIAWVDTLK